MSDKQTNTEFTEEVGKSNFLADLDGSLRATHLSYVYWNNLNPGSTCSDVNMLLKDLRDRDINIMPYNVLTTADSQAATLATGFCIDRIKSRDDLMQLMGEIIADEVNSAPSDLMLYCTASVGDFNGKIEVISIVHLMCYGMFSSDKQSYDIHLADTAEIIHEKHELLTTISERIKARVIFNDPGVTVTSMDFGRFISLNDVSNNSQSPTENQ